MLRQSLLASLLVATAAIPAVASAADNGFYLGGSLGRATTEVSEDDLGLSFDGHDTGFKIIASFRPLDFLGFELNYVDLGTIDDSVGGIDVKADTTGIDGFVVGFLPIPLVDLFAKVGAVNWDSKVSASGLGEVGKGDGTDFAYGVGVQARFGSL